MFKWELMIVGFRSKLRLGLAPTPLVHKLFDKFPVRQVGTTTSVGKVLGNFPFAVKVIKTLSWKPVRDLSFSKVVARRGFGPSILAYHIIFDVFASAGMRREAQRVVRDIVLFYNDTKNGASGLFSTLLGLAGSAGESAALGNVLLMVFVEQQMLDEAINVYMQAKKIELWLETASCNFFLEHLVKCRKDEFVMYLFEELRKSDPGPNVVTYNIMLNYYAKGVFEGNLGLKKATEIMEEMEVKGICRTVSSYGAYVDGLCRAGYAQSALTFIRNLNHRNEPVDAPCYNAVIGGFCQKGEMNEASGVLREMQRRGIFPTVYSYSILIDGFCKIGNVEKGIHFIDEMVLNGIKPDIVSFTPILNALLKTGRMDIALWFFRSLGGCKPDMTAYTTLLSGYCENR